jgi:hypothetical protein
LGAQNKSHAIRGPNPHCPRKLVKYLERFGMSHPQKLERHYVSWIVGPATLIDEIPSLVSFYNVSKAIVYHPKFYHV